MFRKSIAVAAGAALAISFASAPAEAGFHGHVVHVQGWGGRGYTSSRSVSRAPSSVSANRSFQANSGRGITSSRNANWGDGSYSGGGTHTLNNGDTFGRTTTATRNGDGSASYSTTRTGIDGQSTIVSGTVSHSPQ
jgi:hypothetical protein